MREKSDQELGLRIRELREQRSITQVALGRALGIDQSAVSRVEDGKRPLTAKELAFVSSALGVTVGALLEEDAVPVLLRASDSDSQAAKESLEIFSDCIDEYRGVEALAG